jgi:parvulin-like peptidyl-prolyl isomerase
MNRLFLFLILLSFSFLEARIVDGIAIIVEGEAITMAEIRAVSSQMRVNKSKAIDLLIQDRLQTAAMKDIKVPEDEIDAKIAEIAKTNKLSIPKMQKILKQQGTSWVQYRKGMRDSLKKSHFYQDVVVASIPEPTEDELKLYYNNNKKAFTIPSKITMVEYSAKTKKSLINFLKTHKGAGIHSQRMTKQSKNIGIEMLSMFLETANNKYTKILNAGDKFVSYKIVSKQGKMTMPFDVAQGAVTGKWKQEQQGKALKDYFEKLRTRADIQILR